MEETKNFITIREKEQLEVELKNLIEVQRPEVIAQLKTAREYGDLKENQEYDTAKNRQSVIESRITEVQSILKVVKVISDKNFGERVSSGSVIDVEIKGGGSKKFSIGIESANAIKVSPHSPVGNALFHKRVGESIIFDTPKGSQEMKIVKIGK